MRKLAYVIIIGLVVALGWSIAALIDEGIKSGSIGLWSALLGGGWVLIQGAWSNLMTIASADGTTFLIYTLTILLISLPLWVAVDKLWSWGATHRPHFRTPSIGTGSSSGSSGLGTSGIGSTTPAGATVRPPSTEKTATPPATEQVKVEKEVTETEQTTA